MGADRRCGHDGRRPAAQEGEAALVRLARVSAARILGKDPESCSPFGDPTVIVAVDQVGLLEAGLYLSGLRR